MVGTTRGSLARSLWFPVADPRSPHARLKFSPESNHLRSMMCETISRRASVQTSSGSSQTLAVHPGRGLGLTSVVWMSFDIFASWERSKAARGTVCVDVSPHAFDPQIHCHPNRTVGCVGDASGGRDAGGHASLDKTRRGGPGCRKLT